MIFLTNNCTLKVNKYVLDSEQNEEAISYTIVYFY